MSELIPNESSLWKLTSYLLSYPDQSWHDGLSEAKSWAEQVDSQDLVHAIGQFQESDVHELQKRYVNQFDFNESTSLYLTAHEYGDNRERGNALINLRVLLASEGYEQIDQELPDYLPLLFEFMADCENEEKKQHLRPRLAKVMANILEKLDSESPYFSIIKVAATLLPEPESLQFPKREKADTGEMPYPLQFG